MKNNRHRVKKLESLLKRKKVSWQLKDGTTVTAYGDELQDCFAELMRRREHPLLQKILNADLQSYNGDDTFPWLITKLHESRVRQRSVAN